MIPDLKNVIIILVNFLSLIIFFYKSDSVFENGHFKNVQNRKPKNSFKKHVLKSDL